VRSDPIGMKLLEPYPPTPRGSALQIRSMAVHPSMRGQGLGNCCLRGLKILPPPTATNVYLSTLQRLRTALFHCMRRLALGSLEPNRTGLDPVQNYDETIGSQFLTSAVFSALLRCGENYVGRTWTRMPISFSIGSTCG